MLAFGAYAEGDAGGGMTGAGGGGARGTAGDGTEGGLAGCGGSIAGIIVLSLLFVDFLH